MIINDAAHALHIKAISLLMRLLLFFIALAAACSVSSVQTCALTHVDTNSDGFIDAAEIDYFITENPCNARPMPTSGASVISVCDRDSDGRLGVADASHVSGCLTNPGLLALACSICASCA